MNKVVIVGYSSELKLGEKEMLPSYNRPESILKGLLTDRESTSSLLPIFVSI
jgi:hypothetical protein